MAGGISGSLQVLDAREDYPSIRLATKEEREKPVDGVFLLSESGLDSIAKVFRENTSFDCESAKWAQIKVVMYEICKGLCPGTTKETMDKARDVALGVLSEVKINGFDWSGTPTHFDANKPFYFASIGLIFLELEQALTQKDAKSMFRCLVNLMQFQAGTGSEEVLQTIIRELDRLHNRVGIQELSYLVEWFLAHISSAFPDKVLHRIDPCFVVPFYWHEMRNLVGFFYSFLEELSPSVAASFPDLLGQKLACIVEAGRPNSREIAATSGKGVPETYEKEAAEAEEKAAAAPDNIKALRTCSNKLTMLFEICEYFFLFYRSRYSYNSMFVRGEILKKVESIVRQERKKICIEIASLPKEERPRAVEIISRAYSDSSPLDVRREEFCKDLLTSKVFERIAPSSKDIDGKILRGFPGCFSLETLFGPYLAS